MAQAAESLVYDVLGLGATAVDDVLYVGTYPQADTKVPIRRRQRFLGGLTAIALVTAARLGCRAVYGGVLGYDEYSEYVVSCLRNEGVDLNYLVRRSGAAPIRSTIVVGEEHATRTIFFELNEFGGAHPELPQETLIRRSRVLLVDHVGVPGMLRAARVARAARIPIVCDFEQNVSPQFGDLLELVDHLIVSRDFAALLTCETRIEAVLDKLWTPARTAVVVTCGAEGAWYTSQAGIICHLPAFRVTTVDTTGCGDVFHGAYAAGLAWGFDVDRCIRFASAAAALKAAQPGGYHSIPTRRDVETFLNSQP